MAVDGNLVFNTKIDTEGFTKGTKQLSSKTLDLKNKISSTEAAVKNLKAELEKTGNVKVKPKIAESLEKDIAKADSRLMDLRKRAIGMYDSRVSDLRSAGITKGVEDAAERALEQDSAYQKLIADIEKAETQLRKYEAELERVNSAAPLGKDTAEYAQKEQRLNQLTGQLDVYKQKLAETERKEKQQSAQTSTSAGRLATVKRQLERTISALKMFGRGALKAGQYLKSAFSATAGKMISNIGNHFKKANKSTNILESSLKRIKNTLRRMFFFRLVHAPINAIKEAIKEISKISPEFNKNMSALKTEATYLKNSFGALAAPLINLLTPALTSFMQAISGVTDKAAQLVAVLSGQSTYARAVKVQQDYAKSLDESTKSTKANTKAAKENQKALANFDELNVLSQNDDSSEADTDTTSPMFETVSSQVGNLSGKLIDLLKSQDFEAVGKLFGEKINSALSKINWGKIKSTAKKWGSNIAGFLNGAISSINWEHVGNGIANGIGTALTFALSAVRKFNFSNLGTAAGNLINGILSPENAAMFSETASRFLSGIFDALTNAVGTIDWGKVGRTIISLITHFKFSALSGSAIGLLNGFSGALGKLDFKQIGEAFRKGLSRINWKGLWRGVTNLFTNALQGLSDFFGLKGVNTSKLNTALKKLYTPVSNLYSTLKNTLSELLTPLINDFLPSVVEMLGAIMDAAKPIIEAATPILKTVIKVVSQIVKYLAPAVSSIGGAIGKAVKALSPIIKPILELIGNVVKFLAPAIEAIAGFVGTISDLLSPINDFIGGIIGGISDIFGAFTGSGEPTISEELQAELDHLAGVSENLSTISGNIDEAISGVHSSIENTASDLGYIDDLKLRFDELMDKAVLSDKDMQEIQTIGDLLSDKLPGFQEAWKNIIGEDGLNKDTFVKNRKEMKESIDTVIDNLKTQYAVEALQEQFKQLYEARTKANADYKKSADELSGAQSKLLELGEKMTKAQQEADEAQKKFDRNEISSQTYNEAKKAAGDAADEYNEYKKKVEETATKVYEAAAKQGYLNEQMEALSGVGDVLKNGFDALNEPLENWQKLRDAVDMGIVDEGELEKKYKISAETLYKCTKSVSERQIDGYTDGIKDGQEKLKKRGLVEAFEEIGNDMVDGLTEESMRKKGCKKAYDAGSDLLEQAEKGARDESETHSPSAKWMALGEDLSAGLGEGIDGGMNKVLDLVCVLAQRMTAAMQTGVQDIGNSFNVLPGMVKSALNNTLTVFENFLSRLTSGINSTFVQINSLNKAYANSGGKSGSYTTWQPLSAPRIPRLATGAYIPANYGEFLAVLGDNRREAEVVSPVSAMKQAFLEAIAEGNLGGDPNRPIHVTVICPDGSVLLETVGKADDDYTKRHGSSRFRRNGI